MLLLDVIATPLKFASTISTNFLNNNCEIEKVLTVLLERLVNGNHFKKMAANKHNHKH